MEIEQNQQYFFHDEITDQIHRIAYIKAHKQTGTHCVKMPYIIISPDVRICFVRDHSTHFITVSESKVTETKLPKCVKIKVIKTYQIEVIQK